MKKEILMKDIMKDRWKDNFEFREMMVQKTTDRWKNPIFRKRVTEKIRDGMKKVWADEGYRKQMSEIHKGHKHSKKQDEKISEAGKKWHRNNPQKSKELINNMTNAKFRKDIELRKDEVIDLYINKEKGTKEIAKLMECDLCVIKRILIENNIKIRPTYFYTTGEKSFMWNNGSSFEPYGPEFNKKLKKLIRERDGCCMMCNIGFEDLKLLKRRVHIHHIDYNKKCNLPYNLITLCNQCHSKTNFDRKIWAKHFQSLLNERYDYQYSENQEIILKLN